MNSDSSVVSKLAGIFLIIVTALIVASPAVAEVSLAWAKQHQLLAGKNSAVDSAVDKDGNVYVVGMVTGKTGQTSGGFFGGTSTIYYTGYELVKYSPAGVQLWTRNYKVADTVLDAPAAVAVDYENNVVVTGSSGNGSGYDIVTIKYTAAGSTVWEQRYTAAGGYGLTKGMAIDSQNNIIVLAHDKASGGRYLTVKYTSAGVVAWASYYDGTGAYQDVPVAVAVDSSDNVVVMGYSYTSSATGHDYTTVKYASDGTQLWEARLELPGYDSPASMAIDASGNVLVTGLVINPDVTGNRTSYGTVKYASDGTQLWLRRYVGVPTGYGDKATVVAADKDGNVYVAGRSMTSDSNGYEDFSTIKYSPDGVELWVNRYDAGTQDVPSDMAIDASGNVIVTGYSITVDYVREYATIKYSTDGSELWLQKYNKGMLTKSIPSAVAIDSQGNVIITGSIESGFSLFSSNSQFLTVKYNDARANSAPVANAGLDQVLECTGSTTTVALNGGGSSDPDGDVLSYQWAGSFGLRSGSLASVGLGRGTHTASLTVDDGAGMTATDTVNVSIVDTMLPWVDAGADVVLEAQSASGTPYVVNPAAGDGCSPVSVLVSPTMAFYPVTSTTVTATATDESGLSSSDAMVITVQDTTSPVGSVVLNNGAAYTNNTAVNLVINCSDATGCASMALGINNVFGVSEPVLTSKGVSLAAGDGVKTIAVKFTDGYGNTSQAQDTIVLDQTAPVLSGLTNQTAIATSLSGAAVNYAVAANDSLDANPSLACLPVSGSVFALGNTIVICDASDAAGNTVSGSFNVFVDSPVNIAGVTPGDLPQGAIDQVLTITGSNFEAGSTVMLSSGDVIITSTTVISNTQIQLLVSVVDTAIAGLRDVTVTIPNGLSRTATGVFAVISQADAVNNMVVALDQMVLDGSITSTGTADSLIASFSGAISLIDAGQTTAASGVVTSLDNKLDAMVKAGKVSVESAALLKSSLQILKSSL